MFPESKRVLMIQTADAELYSRILAVTSDVNKLFCYRNEIEYQSYIGVKRGFFSWHACFNRIIILNELIQSEFKGWVFYLDADAYIYDLHFDLQRYLAAVAEPFIFAPGGTSGQRWDVNDGVFLINLGDPLSQKLVRCWYENFMTTTEEELKQAKDWHNVQSDQPRLHKVLQSNADLTDAMRHEPREFLNQWNASFVRQVLRSNAESLEDRVKKIKYDVDSVIQKDVKVNGTAVGQTGVTRDEVIYAYRFLLGRYPENEAVIQEHLIHSDLMELRKRFVSSAEFKAKHIQKDFSSIANNEVDVSINEEDFIRLLKHVQASWENLGREKPHWSVLTQEEYLPQNINSNIKSFFETGVKGISLLKHALSRAKKVLPKDGVCVELGCGVGRVSFALAQHFKHVKGIDISSPHLSLAEAHKKNNEVANVSFVLLDSLQTLENLPKYDFFYSAIVLQHNPPPLIDRMLRIMFKKIEDGGMVYFQVPVAREGYRFSIDDYLQSIEKSKVMEMHIFPQVHLFSLLEDCGFRLLDVQRDNSTGREFHSLTVLAERIPRRNNTIV